MAKLLCYGDSNTYGWDPRATLGGRYERPWVTVLQERTGLECVNLGFPGRRIPQSASELRALLSLLEGRLPADGLLILLGTNNRFLAPFDTPESAAEKLKKLLDFVRSAFPALPLLLLGLPPMDLPGQDSAPWCVSFNRHCAVLSEKYSLPYFDPLPLKLPLAFDGLHLTEEGHTFLAEGIERSGILNTFM